MFYHVNTCSSFVYDIKRVGLFEVYYLVFLQCKLVLTRYLHTETSFLYLTISFQ